MKKIIIAVIAAAAFAGAAFAKDRTGLFMDRPEFTITPKVGQAILNWCNLNPQSNIIQPQTPQNYGNSAPTPSR